MNDKEILTDVLSSEKAISNNFSYMINEMSNDYLYDMSYELFDLCKTNARNIYNYMLDNNMYTIEEASENKIKKANTTFNKELK